MRVIITVLMLSAVWVLWSWHFEPIVVGVAIASIAFVTWIVRRLGVLDAEGQPYEINLRLLAYIPWLVWEVIKANIAVAKIILSPKMDIRPHLIRVPAPQRTALGRTIFANTITITPGTISLDVHDDVILVHALSDALADEDSAGHSAKVVCWVEAKVDDAGAAAAEGAANLAPAKPAQGAKAEPRDGGQS